MEKWVTTERWPIFLVSLETLKTKKYSLKNLQTQNPKSYLFILFLNLRHIYDQLQLASLCQI